MPSFAVTITITTTPAVSVTASNVTYDEIRRSLGDYVYLVERIYLFSNSFRQISSVVKYENYDVNGNIKVESLTPTVDPYQTQKSLFYDTKKFDVILNGQSSLDFDLLPNSEIKLEFFTNRLAKRDALDILTPNNFKELESAMGRFSFFEDWETEL
jgi:hypothetical protein